MNSFFGKKLPVISESKVFESFAAALWELRYPESSVTLVGRSGQTQHGLDVLVRTQQGRIIGIQCKAVEKLTKEMLRVEVSKAKQFPSKIDEFVMVTTAPHDVSMVIEAQHLSNANSEKGLFSVAIFGWGELERFMERFPSLVRQFYPEFVDGRGPSPACVTLSVETDLSIAMDDCELLFFCSESAALLKADTKATVKVRHVDELRIKNEIAVIDSLVEPTASERSRRVILHAELDRISPKLRRLETAIEILLTDEVARSPWLIGPDWQATAVVLRSLVTEVVNPKKNPSQGNLSLKIRAPDHPGIVTWIELSGDEKAEFLARNSDYSPYFFLGSIVDLESDIVKRCALPAGIAAIVRYSTGFGIPVEKLCQEGATSIFSWIVEAA